MYRTFFENYICRYSITSTASHSSGGSQIPGGQPFYPGVPGGQGSYPGGGQPGRSNSSPHQPYQPVYPGKVIT